MSEICVSKFHQIASLGLKFGRRPVKNKPLRAGLQWEVGEGMGPVISAGLEGTLGQKCMTQQKKKRQKLCVSSHAHGWSRALVVSGPPDERRTTPTVSHVTPVQAWAGLRNIWNCSVKHICGEHFCAPDRKRNIHKKKKKKKKRRNRKFTWSVAFKWGRSNTTCSFVTVRGTERGGVCSAFTNF